MKLCIAYTVFNSTELLHRNIENHRKFADEVVIFYQTISHSMKPIKRVDLKNIYSTDEKIKKVKYTPNREVDAKQNERLKFREMLKYALHKGCTHMLLMACDEFYDKGQFKKVMNLMDKLDFDVALSQMYTYYKKPNWRLDPPEEYWKPFIMKIHPDSMFTQGMTYPVQVDPALRLTTARKFHLCDREELCMHHYSMVRSDIESKLHNAASHRVRATAHIHLKEFNEFDIKNNKPITYFGGRTVKEVECKFGLC